MIICLANNNALQYAELRCWKSKQVHCWSSSEDDLLNHLLGLLITWADQYSHPLFACDMLRWHITFMDQWKSAKSHKFFTLKATQEFHYLLQQHFLQERGLPVHLIQPSSEYEYIIFQPLFAKWATEPSVSLQIANKSGNFSLRGTIPQFHTMDLSRNQ